MEVALRRLQDWLLKQEQLHPTLRGILGLGTSQKVLFQTTEEVHMNLTGFLIYKKEMEWAVSYLDKSIKQIKAVETCFLLTIPNHLKDKTKLTKIS
jgi:hypothetical protein